MAGVSDGRGLVDLPEAVLDTVLRAVWWETHACRAGLHRSAGVRRCDVLLVRGSLRLGPGSGPASAGLHVGGDCLCRDQLVDVLVEVDAFIRRSGGSLRNPAGAVRRHIRTRVAGDWTRRRRVEVGAQARSDRIRAGARASRLPDEVHRAVLEYLVDEAGSVAPLHDDEQLIMRLAVRASAEFGGTVEAQRARIVDMLPLIESVCRAGPTSDVGDGEQVTWWERYIDRPLGRRARRDVAIDAVPERYWSTLLPAERGAADGDDPRSAVLAGLRSLGPAALPGGVRTVLREMADRGLVPAPVAGTDDRCRIAAVVEILRAEGRDGPAVNRLRSATDIRCAGGTVRPQAAPAPRGGSKGQAS